MEVYKKLLHVAEGEIQTEMIFSLKLPQEVVQKYRKLKQAAMKSYVEEDENLKIGNWAVDMLVGYHNQLVEILEITGKTQYKHLTCNMIGNLLVSDKLETVNRLVWSRFRDVKEKIINMPRVYEEQYRRRPFQTRNLVENESENETLKKNIQKLEYNESQYQSLLMEIERYVHGVYQENFSLDREWVEGLAGKRSSLTCRSHPVWRRYADLILEVEFVAHLAQRQNSIRESPYKFTIYDSI